MTAVNSQFLCTTDQWFTPTCVLDMVRQVLGNIELDPASSAQANERVKAVRFFDVHTNGLVKSWNARSIFLNPPGGRLPGITSLPVVFWKKLMSERKNFGHAIYVAFSVQQLQTLQGKGCASPFDFTFCVPKKRLQFYSPTRHSNGAPHGNAIVYVPGTENLTHKFISTFKNLGAVK